ncbi:MAG: hypothetical protein FWH22_03355 [Fibromonadales bacterium]|nr:hypothetical protein [Fibromonadales bacterium]
MERGIQRFILRIMRNIVQDIGYSTFLFLLLIFLAFIFICYFIYDLIKKASMAFFQKRISKTNATAALEPKYLNPEKPVYNIYIKDEYSTMKFSFIRKCMLTRAAAIACDEDYPAFKILDEQKDSRFNYSLVISPATAEDYYSYVDNVYLASKFLPINYKKTTPKPSSQ